MNISQAITRAASILDKNGVPNPLREARSLLLHVLERETAYVVAHPEYRLTENESIDFEAVLRRRASREPFQYITGRQEFYGLEFEVAPGVLIPRPETEILVEAAISLLNAADKPRFCEVGIGSGCIAISILYKILDAQAVGVDISRAALELTARNATKHGVGDRLTLREADMFAGLGKFNFDLILSNPPYIPESDLESLQAEVGGFEPHSALFGGADGLDIIKLLIANAPRFLKSGGFLLIEIGFGQAASVKGLFGSSFWKDIVFLPDLQGIPRIVRARLAR